MYRSVLKVWGILPAAAAVHNENVLGIYIELHMFLSGCFSTKVCITWTYQIHKLLFSCWKSRLTFVLLTFSWRESTKPREREREREKFEFVRTSVKRCSSSSPPSLSLSLSLSLSSSWNTKHTDERGEQAGLYSCTPKTWDQSTVNFTWRSTKLLLSLSLFLSLSLNSNLVRIPTRKIPTVRLVCECVCVTCNNYIVKCGSTDRQRETEGGREKEKEPRMHPYNLFKDVL